MEEKKTNGKQAIARLRTEEGKAQGQGLLVQIDERVVQCRWSEGSCCLEWVQLFGLGRPVLLFADVLGIITFFFGTSLRCSHFERSLF